MLMTATFDIDFDAKNLRLVASGSLKGKMIEVERISSPFAPRQISEAVRLHCGDDIDFRIRSSAERFRAGFVGAGCVIAPTT